MIIIELNFWKQHQQKVQFSDIAKPSDCNWLAQVKNNLQ